MDTAHLLLRLPEDKLQRLTILLQAWSTKKWCFQKDLESLCGLLNHACKVIRAGRSFLRRMLDLLHETCHPPRGRTPIRINAGFRSDLAWWLTFVESWNGTSFLPPPPYLPHRQFTSDASGSWGCGAWHINSWFQIPWDIRSSPLSIAEKELLPIIVACWAWGRTWSGLHIQCRCDNQVVVAGIRLRSSKAKGIMHLLRCLVFIEAYHHFHLSAQYINTHANHLADDLFLPCQGSSCRPVPNPSLATPLGTTPQPTGGLDLSQLEDSVQHYFQQGLAPSTQNAYKAATRRFHTFCAKYNVWNPFPVSEKLLCAFVAYLANDGLAPQTCKSYLAAVRNIQLSLGLPDPREQSSLPVLKRVQAGISRARMLRGGQAKLRLPITIQILEGLFDTLMRHPTPENTVIWAIAAVAFFGFFRLGELLLTSGGEFNPAIHLAWGDVSIDDWTHPTMAQIHLKKSKCDQLGKGADIIVGKTESKVCPVLAILNFVEVRRKHPPGPFFLNPFGKPVTKSAFTTKIRASLRTLGLPQDQFAGHSFRIGAATTAALVGIEDSAIQKLGRWHSSAFLLYVRSPKEHLAALSSTLASTPKPSS